MSGPRTSSASAALLANVQDAFVANPSMRKASLRTLPLFAFLGVFQALMLILFCLFTTYADIHTETMLLVGFGFLYTFQSENTFSGVGFNLLVACQAIQFSTITNWLFAAMLKSDATFAPIKMDVVSLIEGDYAAAAALIAMGVLLGKASALQLSVMTVLMMPVYSLNQTICETFLLATDVGGSMFIHTFGAAFGLGCAWSHRGLLSAYTPHAGVGSNRTTDTFALVGSVFLFMYWPSFNAALVESGAERQRAVVNTVISLVAAALAAMMTSSSVRVHALNNGRYKLDPWDLANGILGGGVAIGSTCNMLIGPGAAMLVGVLAGITTVLGFSCVQPWVQRRFSIHDSCGVQALHGMCGILGALASAVAALLATATQYGGKEELAHIFPVRAESGAFSAAVAQLLALVVTLGIAGCSGAATGYLLQLRVLDGPRAKSDLYTDKYDWIEEEGGDSEEHQGPDLDV